jgi:hypothetical protein
MAGLQAPEFVCGALQDVIGRLWTIRFSDLLTVPEDMRALTSIEQQVLAEDLAAAKAHIQLNLQTKTDWRLRLPWLLIGVAHTREDTARQCARQALEAFDADPRQAAQHRISWLWLNNASPLRECFQAFVDGAGRESLNPRFQSVLATMRFIPIVETTIEAKHAKVALQSQTGLGPVRVSLSNRLPLMESRIASNPQYLAELVECFGLVRKFKKVPMFLGFERHPLLHTMAGKHHSVWVPTLTRIIYRCALEDLFDDKTAHAKYHNKKMQLIPWLLPMRSAAHLLPFRLQTKFGDSA